MQNEEINSLAEENKALKQAIVQATNDKERYKEKVIDFKSPNL